MSRSRRAIAAALAVLLVGGIAVVVAAVVHKGKGDKGANGGNHPQGTVAPGTANLGTVQPFIPALSADQLGIATGVVLFTSPVADIDRDMAGMAAVKAKWVRTAVRWDLVEPDSASSDDWTKVDALVKDAQADGLQLILDINGTPKWARASGTGTAAFPEDLHTYAAFAAKVAARYRGKVAAYELGNEPNHLKSFAHPSAAVYEQVLQFSYPLIKAADPDVKVLTGGLGGSRDKKGNISGDVFLDALYKAGAKPYFDGVSYHPYTYPLAPSDDTGSRGWSRMIHARQIMVDNGDGDKKIWITEFGAPTSGPNPVTQEKQAQIMHDAYQLWSTYSWAGPLCWFDYRDKGTDQSDHGNFFGLYTNDGQPKLALKQFETLVRPAN
jgi:polysaccharide biosynthesis protein PslG